MGAPFFQENISRVNEVFVFGAGASAALANLPLGNELIWNYHRNCTLCSPIINGIPDNTQDDIQFAGLKEFLILASNIYPELRPKVKEFENRGITIFSPIVDSKKYFADEILKVVSEKGNQEGTSFVKKLIFKHLDRASLSNSEAYKDFIEKILINRKANNVSIISFNFDCLLNDYYENGIDNGIYFDYLLDFDCILKDCYKFKNPVPLIKLNGSLDWGICRSCNKLRLYFPHMLDRYYFKEGFPKCGCGEIMEPYIFIPHQKYDERISLLWSKAEDVLREANKVTIIGYSFPEYDQKAMDLFNYSLSSIVELEIVDYCEENKKDVTLKCLNEKYKKIFPKFKNEIKISLYGFKKFLYGYNN